MNNLINVVTLTGNIHFWSENDLEIRGKYLNGVYFQVDTNDNRSFTNAKVIKLSNDLVDIEDIKSALLTVGDMAQDKSNKLQVTVQVSFEQENYINNKKENIKKDVFKCYSIQWEKSENDPKDSIFKKELVKSSSE